MSRFFTVLIILVLLVAGALIAAPSFIPVETYKPQIAKLVKEQTGRDLTINGGISLSFLPRVAVTVENVTFSNASWADNDQMASMESLEVVLQVLPLFKGDIALDRFVLVKPDIDLAVNRQGVGNWVFTPATGTAPSSSAPATPGSGSDSAGPAIQNVQLGKIAIEGGSVRYSDARSGAKYNLSAIDIDLSLPSLDAPLGLDGSFIWNGDKVALNLDVAAPRALSTGGSSAIELVLDAPKVKATFGGNATISPVLTVTGNAELSVPSVRELASWAGQPLAPGDGFGPLDLKGAVDVKGDVYRFADAALSFDGMNGSGDLAVDAGRARPKLSGSLALDRLDANIYLGDADTPGGSGSTPASTSGGSGAAAGGWSDALIDMSGLKAVDVDLNLSVQEIFFQDLKIGESAVGLNLVGGKLTSQLTKLDLYDGKGTGQLVLDGSRGTPGIAAKFDLAGISAFPLLRDAAGFERLDGAGTISIDVTTSGNSQKAMMNALNGNGSVRFADGAIRGINIAQLMRNVFSAATSGWESGGTQSTDFSELGGTFTIAQGVLTNNDLQMLSPLVRVNGKGSVNMPNQTLNYRVEPKLAATLEGQGGGSEVKGIEVPVMITGSWSDPKFAPDLAAVLSNREGIKDAIDAVKEDGGKGLLRGLLGGGQQQAPAESGATDGAAEGAVEGAVEGAPAAEPEKVKPEDVIRGLFGR
ncbi:MAG: AsmA family protein [Parvibaculum sp.]